MKFVNVFVFKRKKLKNKTALCFKETKKNKLRADGSFNLMSNGVQHQLI